MNFEIKDKKIKKYLRQIQMQGGTCYLVGGYLRDQILNRKAEDIDIEVHNLTFEQLSLIFGEEAKIYKRFGVFALKGTTAEFTLPRIDNKIGNKHTDFNIIINPEMDLKSAAKRRDFTMNTLMYDIFSKKLIDNYHGIKDINSKKIVPVSDKFPEDPLRILRAVRFSFQLGFAIDKVTFTYCINNLKELQYIDLNRKNSEFKKMFLKNNSLKEGMKGFNAIVLPYFDLVIHKHSSDNSDKDIGNRTVNVSNREKINENIENLQYFKEILTNNQYFIIIISLILKNYEISKKQNDCNFSKIILDDIITSQKEKKQILKIVGNIFNEKLYTELSAEEQYEIYLKHGENINLFMIINVIQLNELSQKKISDLYQQNLLIIEHIKKLQMEYNGNYFIKKGYTGKKIFQMQKDKIIFELKKFSV